MESGTANLLKMLEERVKELCYQEKWDEAVAKRCTKRLKKLLKK